MMARRRRGRPSRYEIQYRDELLQRYRKERGAFSYSDFHQWRYEQEEKLKNSNSNSNNPFQIKHDYSNYYGSGMAPYQNLFKTEIEGA